MVLYKFMGPNNGRVALTADKEGKNLPGGPWTYRSTENVELQGRSPRVGKSSADILADIAKRGYCLWPDK